MTHLSRRQWLAASALAAHAWSHPLPATELLTEFSFAIVSDTHLGRKDSKTPERQWRQATEEITTAPVDFVLHLGDVVDAGRESQYPIYSEIRQGLGKLIFEVPGNHDPAELFKKYIRTPIDTAFDHCGVRFLLFSNVHRDSHMGFIKPEQIEWLDEQCRDAAERELRIAACCHVPIHVNRHPDRGWYVKPDDGQTAYYEVVDRYADRFLASFHGHFHNGIRGWRDHGTLLEVLCPSTCYNQDRKLGEHIKAKTTSGFFVHELRPGYVVATLGKGRLSLQYKPLSSKIHGEYTAEFEKQ